ncbi:MAG: hypothetical protein ACFCGT_24290 [Sandaracinaceae bacterium]
MPVPLAPGFTPDPVRVRDQVRGEVPLDELGGGCGGYTSTRPSQVLELAADFRFLRLALLASAPAALAVRGPDGAWRCGDADESRAPMVEGEALAGSWEVWVTTPEPGARVVYQLLLSELPTLSPEMTGGETVPLLGRMQAGLATSATSGRFRDRRLRRGFLPDPRRDDGEASGDVDVRGLGAGCRGFVEAEPNHVLLVGRVAEDGDLCEDFVDEEAVAHEFDYFRVQVMPPAAAARATLLVGTPDGRFLCASILEPTLAVEQDHWPVGCYPIWVGVRDRGERVPYEVVYTEARSAP